LNSQLYRAFQEVGQAKFPEDGWLDFRLEPIFNTAPGASKNDAQFKNGQYQPKNTIISLCYLNL